jgi:hypothetical protein
MQRARRAGTKIDRIRAAMVSGEPMSVEDVANATGLPRKEVGITLASEVRHERMKRIRSGLYQYGSPPEAPAERAVEAAVAHPKAGPLVVMKCLNVVSLTKAGHLLCRDDEGTHYVAHLAEIVEVQ